MPCGGAPIGSEVHEVDRRPAGTVRLDHLGQDIATHTLRHLDHPIIRGAGPGLAEGCEGHAVLFFESRQFFPQFHPAVQSLPERAVHPIRHVLEVLHQQAFTGSAHRAVGPEHGEVFLDDVQLGLLQRHVQPQAIDPVPGDIGPRPARHGPL